MRLKPKLRVFLDSNVIFSGLYSAEGAPGIILERLIEGELKGVISQQVLDEVVRAIKLKLPEALPALRKLLMSLPLEIRPDPLPEEIAFWTGVIHSEDASILAAAVAAQPDYLITGDKHFWENPDLSERSGLRIVAPAQFLECLGEDTELSQ
jgi:putative PIN family toxin of toxin-antitoxin system